WGAAFGSSGTPPQEWETFTGFQRQIEGGKTGPALPNWQPLLFLFILLLFVRLPITIGSAVLTVVPVKGIPADLDRLRPWRWAVVGGLCLFALLLLGLQSLMGYSMESNAKAQVAKAVSASDEKPKTDDEANIRIAMKYNSLGIEHTSFLRLVILLEFVAVVAAALQLWIEALRTPQQPVPRLELPW